jgi:DNA sulfur modification protein DndC
LIAGVTSFLNAINPMVLTARVAARNMKGVGLPKRCSQTDGFEERSMPVSLPVVGRNEISVFDQKPVRAFQQEVQEIYLADNRPWVIGYSGGKDSTATLQLIWYAIADLPPNRRHKRVFVIASDTFVETPVIVDHVNDNLEAVNREAPLQGLPFEANKVVPEIRDTFWVNLLGRGYPAPSTKFRWCTDRMKIQPANRFILDRVAEFGEVVMVLGARRGESSTRDQVLKAHEIAGSRLRRHTSLPNAFVYAPIEEFTTEDVWLYLLQVKCPWRTDNTRLIGMYKNAQGGVPAGCGHQHALVRQQQIWLLGMHSGAAGSLDGSDD